MIETARVNSRAGGDHRKLSLVLIVIASLLAFLAIFALWANRQLLNNENWTETSTQLIENQEIRDQVGIFLADELFANVDVEAQLQEGLPPRLAPLAGPVAGALRDVAERAAKELLSRPRAQALWVEANRRAHQRFLFVVEGGGDVVSTANGDVTLELEQALRRTAERVGLGERAQEAIPEGAGQITILQSDKLAFVQDLVWLLKILAIALVVLALGLFAAGVYLARGRRREALRTCGVGLLFAGVAALTVRSLAGDAIVDSLAESDAVRPAVDQAWTISTRLLEEAAAAAVGYGVVLVVAAWLAGPTSLGTAVRRGMAPFLRERAYAYGVLVAIVLLVINWSPTPATRRLLPALILIALLVAGTEALRRQTMREYPDADAGDTLRGARDRISGRGSPKGAGRVDGLERLARLRDDGVLDAAEFEREKQRLLA